jgi:glycosyltransferase involved in cell wall biosynthesis
MSPLFSIIIPTFQSSGVLKDCLESISRQSYASFEVLIMDACSTDDSLYLIKSFKDIRIRFISQSDLGVYDAMNKGIEHAKGEWILFLGSDDKLHDQAVLKDISKVVNKTKKSVVYGDVRVDGNVSWAKGEKVYGGKFSLYRLLRRNICHQAIFYNRSFLQQHQLKYNLTYRVSADWDLNLRTWLIKPFQYYPRIISTFTAGGISSGGKDDGFQQSVPSLYKQYMNNPYTNPFMRFFYGLYRRIVS